jgi:hypothetical protein
MNQLDNLDNLTRLRANKDEIISALASGARGVADFKAIARGFKLSPAESKTTTEWDDADKSITADVQGARERFTNEPGRRLAQAVATHPKDRRSRLMLVEEMATAGTKEQFAKIKAAASDARRTLARTCAPWIRSIGQRFEAHIEKQAIASWERDRQACQSIGIPPEPSAVTLAIAGAWRCHQEIRKAATTSPPSPDPIRSLIKIWISGARPESEPAGRQPAQDEQATHPAGV